MTEINTYLGFFVLFRKTLMNSSVQSCELSPFRDGITFPETGMQGYMLLMKWMPHNICEGVK